MPASSCRTAWLALASLLCVASLPIAQGAEEPDFRPDKPEALAPRARPRGFQWIANSKAIVPKSGKRSHVFYVGEPIRFELASSAAR